LNIITREDGQPGVGRRIVEAAVERFGRIDTVVNNAGIFIAKGFADYTRRSGRRVHR
jgi:NAD(P)-dependent dehydrogenase (short-subunit alcohol dehydrogenase family)